jgi:hypothetical protein
MRPAEAATLVPQEAQQLGKDCCAPSPARTNLSKAEAFEN